MLVLLAKTAEEEAWPDFAGALALFTLAGVVLAVLGFLSILLLVEGRRRWTPGVIAVALLDLAVAAGSLLLDPGDRYLSALAGIFTALAIGVLLRCRSPRVED